MRVPWSILRGSLARSRLVRAAVALAGALAVAYALALTVLWHPAVQARLRERIVEGLRVRFGADTVLEGDVGVDPLLRVSLGPLAVRGPTPGAPPFVRVERVTARPRLAALLAGRIEPASVELSSGRIALASAPPGLGALAGGERQRRASAPGGPRQGELVVRFRELVVEVEARGRALELGPVDGELTRERDGGGERVALDLQLPGDGRIELEARREPGGGWGGRVRASRLGPELVPAVLRGGAAELSAGAVSFTAEGAAAPDLATAEVRFEAGAEGVVVAGERIGPAPAGPMQASVQGTLRWRARDRRLTLAGGRLTLLGAIPARVDGELRLVAGDPFHVSVRAEGVEYTSAVGALPAALAPPAAVGRPAGTLDARAELAGPLLAPSAWTLSAALDLSRMRAAARAAPPVALRGPFVHRWTDHGRELAMVVGPANPDFVPIAELPAHVVRAVTTSEDGGFFGHQGFDFGELRNALAEGAEAGRVVRGGSTITQQLAKNLFLTGERTLARKVREAATAIALEATVPKARLLEIYLNVVEWGPGIRGIGPAARLWFGKDPRALTPAEAALLASVIPAPARYHLLRERGPMAEWWRRRVEHVLLKMTEQGVLANEELVRALADPVVFTRG